MTQARWTGWFELNREERRWAAVIIAIFLVGLAARAAYEHLRDRSDGPGENVPADLRAGEDALPR